MGMARSAARSPTRRAERPRMARLRLSSSTATQTNCLRSSFRRQMARARRRAQPRVSCARWIKPLTRDLLRECASLCWHAPRPAVVAGTASLPSRAHLTRQRQCLVATHSCDRTVLKLCWPWPCRPNPRRAFRYTLSCSPQSRLRTLSRMGASARPEASISSASARRS